MSEVWITKTGFRATEWDGEIRQYVDKRINHIFQELRSTCHIEPDVTLGDIVRITAENGLLSFLIAGYSGCDVKAFAEEMERPAAKKSDLECIQLKRMIKIRDDEVQDNIDVNGVGPNEEGEKIDNWAIELTPVNEMKDIPVRLNPKVTVYDSRGGTSNYDYKETPTELDTYFSLLEVIGEIFHEISCTGSPADRDEMSRNLIGMVEDIKSGVAKTEPWEDIKPKVQ